MLSAPSADERPGHPRRPKIRIPEPQPDVVHPMAEFFNHQRRRCECGSTPGCPPGRPAGRWSRWSTTSRSSCRSGSATTRVLRSRGHLRPRQRDDRRLDRGRGLRPDPCRARRGRLGLDGAHRGASSRTSCSTTLRRRPGDRRRRDRGPRPRVGDLGEYLDELRREVGQLPRLRADPHGGPRAAVSPRAGRSSTSAATGSPTTPTTSRRLRPSRCSGSPAFITVPTATTTSIPTCASSICTGWTTTSAASAACLRGRRAVEFAGSSRPEGNPQPDRRGGRVRAVVLSRRQLGDMEIVVEPIPRNLEGALLKRPEPTARARRSRHRRRSTSWPSRRPPARPSTGSGWS